MTDDRHSMIPLALGLAFSLAVHLALGVAYVDSRTLPRLADLAAESLVGQSPFAAGQPATITLDVANVGDRRVDRFAVQWQIDGHTVAQVEITDRLDPGDVIALTQTFNDVPAGVHTVRATLDPQRAIDESREDNNVIEQSFIWQQPASGATGEAALADLVVASIKPQSPLVAGEPAALVAEVANIGRADAGPMVLRLDMDDQPITELNVHEGVPAGAVVAVPIELIVDEPGEHRVCALADADDVVVEMREDNNANCAVLSWQAADEPLIGSPDGQALQMRLVSADDFERIQTPYDSQLEQPMLQATATPTPEAPIQIVDPTDPGRTSPQVAAASPSRQSPTPQPPQPPTTEPQPDEPDQQGGVVEPAIDDVQEATRAPNAEAPAEQADAPAEGEVEPHESIERVGERKRINVLVDQTPRTTPVDDRGNFEGDAEAVVRNIEPPVAPDEVTDDGELPRAIEHGQVSDEVKQQGADRDPDDEADPADATMEVASATNGQRQLPTMPVEPDREATPRSPDAAEAEQAEDRQSEAPQEKADEPSPPKEAAADQPRESQQSTQPTQPTTAATQNSEQRQPSEPSQANPTAAMRSESESPPISRIDYARIKPGGVESVQGIKITTVVPRFSTVAQMTTVPANPSYRVHFNAEGKVTKIEQLQSTGYVNVDAPIMTAIYKWTAKGDIDEDGLTIDRLDIQLNVRE